MFFFFLLCVFVRQVSELCNITAHVFTKQQLLHMEPKLLIGLKFQLSYCPPLRFVAIFSTVSQRGAAD